MTTCAACTADFQQATSVKSGCETPFKPGMIVVCIHCGTILRIVSPGESRVADPEIDNIPQEAFDIACEIVYSTA
jgi:hypothetical protein